MLVMWQQDLFRLRMETSTESDELLLGPARLRAALGRRPEQAADTLHGAFWLRHQDLASRAEDIIEFHETAFSGEQRASNHAERLSSLADALILWWYVSGDFDAPQRAQRLLHQALDQPGIDPHTRGLCTVMRHEALLQCWVTREGPPPDNQPSQESEWPIKGERRSLPQAMPKAPLTGRSGSRHDQAGGPAAPW
ncbi:hypothetical protein [Streptomyces sp. NPDC088246]|uniref:hypothetical protein n=1 Tax=Streptomyces sp. NPDC088246 TaxID=3365842 RepID=UPI00380DA8F4